MPVRWRPWASSDEPIVRRVKVILHEDLHGDVNFALPWEIEEGIVTPLGSFAAVEYFRWKNEQKEFAKCRDVFRRRAGHARKNSMG